MNTLTAHLRDLAAQVATRGPFASGPEADQFSALLHTRATGDGAILCTLAPIALGVPLADADGASADDTLAMLRTLTITDRHLCDVFGPQHEKVTDIIHRIATITTAEATALAAAAHVAPQEREQARTRAWSHISRHTWRAVRATIRDAAVRPAGVNVTDWDRARDIAADAACAVAGVTHCSDGGFQRCDYALLVSTWANVMATHQRVPENT
jgi:hypothetical protein